MANCLLDTLVMKLTVHNVEVWETCIKIIKKTDFPAL